MKIANGALFGQSGCGFLCCCEQPRRAPVIIDPLELPSSAARFHLHRQPFKIRVGITRNLVLLAFKKKDFSFSCHVTFRVRLEQYFLVVIVVCIMVNVRIVFE